MTAFEAYQAARETQRVRENRLTEARREYQRQLREAKGAWPNDAARCEAHCAKAHEAVRVAIPLAQAAKQAAWAAADAVEDKALMADEWL